MFRICALALGRLHAVMRARACFTDLPALLPATSTTWTAGVLNAGYCRVSRRRAKCRRACERPGVARSRRGEFAAHRKPTPEYFCAVIAYAGLLRVNKVAGVHSPNDG